MPADVGDQEAGRSSAEASANARPLSRLPTTVRSLAVVIVGTGLAKAVVLGRDLLVAALFGTSPQLDGFFLALLVPATLAAALGGALTAASIPAIMRARTQGGEDAWADLLRRTTTLGVVLFTAVAVTLAVTAVPVLALLTAEVGPEAAGVIRSTYWIMIPVTLLAGLTLVWSGVLNSRGRFALASLSPACPPLGAIVGVVIGGSVLSLAVGTLVGFLAELLFIRVLLRRQRIPAGLSKPRWDHRMRTTLGAFTSLTAAGLLSGSTLLIDNLMAVGQGPGSVSALTFGSRVATMGIAVGGAAIGTVMLPRFAAAAARQDRADMGATLRRACSLTLAATVPLAVAVALLSEDIVRLLYLRGAFASDDAVLVAEIQALYVLQIPFYFVGIVGVRCLNALGRNGVFLALGVMNVVVNVAGNVILLRLMGLPGIALSTTIMYVVSSAVVLGLLERELRPTPEQKPTTTGDPDAR